VANFECTRKERKARKKPTRAGKRRREQKRLLWISVQKNQGKLKSDGSREHFRKEAQLEERKTQQRGKEERREKRCGIASRYPFNLSKGF